MADASGAEAFTAGAPPSEEALTKKYGEKIELFPITHSSQGLIPIDQLQVILAGRPLEVRKILEVDSSARLYGFTFFIDGKLYLETHREPTLGAAAKRVMAALQQSA